MTNTTIENALVKAFEKANNKTTTLNGAKIRKSSENAIVDFFFAIGASRTNGKTDANIVTLFEKAVAADLDLAVRVMLYARDVRGGMGERNTFRVLARRLASQNPEATLRVLQRVPELGRWDDVLAFVDTAVGEQALDMYAVALRAGDALAAKWAPREKSAKKALATRLRRHMGLKAVDYRKLLSSATKVVETQMCDKDFRNINFSHVPSLAAARYQRAFGKNAPEEYQAYLSALERGDADVKINASAVYPYDIVKSSGYGDMRASQQQWDALPDYIAEGKKFLPIADVSGSMSITVSGMTTAMDISISLGLYCAERNKSVFEGKLITFSERPTWIDVKNLSLDAALNTIRCADWGMNTDFQAVYNMILNLAVKNKVPQEDMPDMLIVFSDMQFDQSTYRNKSVGVFKDMRKRFKDAGYQMPQLVFWNLRDYGQNTPVKFNKDGTALVSGFSPSLMKSVLAADMEAFTPFNIVLDTVMKDRYNW